MKNSLYMRLKCFDFNWVSTTDLVLNSPRDHLNTHRLAENWRPIWEGLFREFPNTQFVVYHNHGHSKINLPNNVDVRTGWLSAWYGTTD